MERGAEMTLDLILWLCIAAIALIFGYIATRPL